MTNSILCMLLKVLFHPSDSSRTWQNSSKLEPAYVHKKCTGIKWKARFYVLCSWSFWRSWFWKESRPKRCWCMLRNVRLTQDSMLSRISRSSSVTKTWSSQSHNCTRRTWAILSTEIQRTAETYWRIYGIISVILWRHKHVHNITRISIVVSHFSHCFHDSEIIWHSFYGWINLIMYKYSYKSYVNGNKVFGLRYSDFCSFLSEPLKLFSTLKHLANPTSKPCHWRLINHIFSSLTDHFEIKSRIVLKIKLDKQNGPCRWMVLWPGTLTRHLIRLKMSCFVK